jgi:hypothetical protein
MESKIGNHDKKKTPINTKKNSINQTSKIKCSFCSLELESKFYKLHLESHPSKILDWLYLGSYNNATNKKELSSIKVKYVLNCAKECKNLFEKEFTYMHLKLSVLIFKFRINRQKI